MSFFKRKNLPLLNKTTNCHQCQKDFSIFNSVYTCFKCQNKFCTHCVEKISSSFTVFRSKRFWYPWYAKEFCTIPEAERESVDFSEYEFIEDENDIKPEEYYAHPEEAKMAQTIVKTGIRARPSSIQFHLNRDQGVVLIREDPMIKFNVVKQLGEGGYANVQMVEDLENTEHFALKQVKPKNEKQNESVLNEIYLMQCSDCDNITKYHATYFHNESYWIQLELCDLALTDLCLEKGGDMPEYLMAYICQHMLLGLQYLHNENRIHRDIKSDNIFLTLEGGVKLGDFGFAAQLTEAHQYRNTFVGTACWMAPELVKGSEYSSKIDIWALGIVALELADKEPPYITIPPVRAIYIISTSPPPTFNQPEKWSPEFVDFTKQCLCREPEDRPTAAELLEHPFLTKACPKELFSDFLTSWKS